MKELWRPIPGHESLYEASNLGRIRSKDHYIITKAGVRRFCEGRVLKPVYEKGRNRNRASVFLCDGGDMKRYRIARLVAMAWCEGFKEGLTVDHVDGNSLNDRADNLEWVSLKENMQRACDLGLVGKPKRTILEDEHGNRFEFRSVREACAFLGKVNQYINTTITSGHTLHGKCGEIYKLIGDKNVKTR